MPNYPSSNYNTSMINSNTTMDNVTEHREIKDYTVGDGTPIRTLQTETYNDFVDYQSGNGVVIQCMNEIAYYLTLIGRLTGAKEWSYFAKLKQMKILRLTRLAKKMSFEMARLRLDENIQENDTTTRLPNAADEIYPSGKTRW